MTSDDQTWRLRSLAVHVSAGAESFLSNIARDCMYGGILEDLAATDFPMP